MPVVNPLLVIALIFLIDYSSRKEELEDFYDLSDIKSVEFNLWGTGFSSGDVQVTVDLKKLVIRVYCSICNPWDY